MYAETALEMNPAYAGLTDGKHVFYITCTEWVINNIKFYTS